VPSGVLLFLLTAFFGYLTTQHASFSAAGFTVALVLLFGHQQHPWELAWYRVLYTVAGAVVAFGVGVLVWPVRARENLRSSIARLLEDCSLLVRLVTDIVLTGILREQDLHELARTILEHCRTVPQGLNEARSEPARSRFDHDAYVSFVEELDRIRQRLLAMRRDTAPYAESEIRGGLVPLLLELCRSITEGLATLASEICGTGAGISLARLDRSIAQVETDLTKLRETRMTAPLALDQMLPFWSLIFNLKELAAGVRNLAEKLPQLL
jgi:uncharacterized membrane protein YccC